MSAADDAAIADLETSLEAPSNTPDPAQSTSTPDPTADPKADATPPSETPKPEDTFEQRYKNLQKTFTQKTQHLATVETKLGQFEKWYTEQYQPWAANLTAPKEDPDSIPTAQKVEEVVQDRLAKERTKILHEVKHEIAANEIKRYERSYAEDLSKFTQDIVNNDPLLKAQIEGPEDTSLYESLIKYGQTKLFGPNADPEQPKTIENFKAHIKGFAERKSAALKKLITNHEQAAAARQTKASQPSMAPSGGKVPAVQAPSKAPKFGSSAFQDYLLQAVNEEQATAKAQK